jgi:ERO1-like protein alpha
VDDMNLELLPLLGNLTETAFFRYFKVNLYCDCPLWPEDGMCALQACSVCECDEAEVPLAWRQDEQRGSDDCSNTSTLHKQLLSVHVVSTRSHYLVPYCVHPLCIS